MVWEDQFYKTHIFHVKLNNRLLKHILYNYIMIYNVSHIISYKYFKYGKILFKYVFIQRVV